MAKSPESQSPQENLNVPEGFRALVISRVEDSTSDPENAINIWIEGAAISFTANKDWLREHDIEPDKLSPGDTLFVKGKGGNEDAALARPDTLEDIQKS